MKRKQPRQGNILVYIVSALVVAAALYLIFNPLQPLTGRAVGANQTEMRCISIHWHAQLKIAIEGAEQPIPTEVGIKIGKVIDTQLSGSRASPIHTHDASGILHVENICVQRKPETTTLGYFFHVWEKTFNSTCIFEYCNDGQRKVKFSVNRKQNNEYGNYVIKDGDELLITYGEPVVSKTSGLVRAELIVWQRF